MASIVYDSELMTNYLAAVPVPAGSQFFTVLDPVTSRPIVFALSNDAVPRLQATKVCLAGSAGHLSDHLQDDKNGQRQLIDIGKILGIADDTRIQTFEVKQLDDKSIVLCVAVRINDTTSRLLLCRPFQMTSPPQITALPPQNLSQISKIFIVCKSSKGLQSLANIAGTDCFNFHVSSCLCCSSARRPHRQGLGYLTCHC